MRKLTLAAVQGETVLAAKTFAPDAKVTVGSNSGNDLVIPEKFELTSYTLVTAGPTLHLLPPLFVQATVRVGEGERELKGYFRDLKKKWPELPEALPLVSDRFLIRYATGIAFIGRFSA